MRAGLVANTIHVPGTWATWRRHAKQATPVSGGNTGEWESRVEDMIRDALGACEAYLDTAVLAGLKSHWLDWSKEMRTYTQNCGTDRARGRDGSSSYHSFSVERGPRVPKSLVG